MKSLTNSSQFGQTLWRGNLDEFVTQKSDKNWQLCEPIRVIITLKATKDKELNDLLGETSFH